MKNYFLLYILTLILYSCSGDYNDISASIDEIKFYNLEEQDVFDDNGTNIILSLPQEWRRVDEELLSEKSIMQFVFDKASQESDAIYTLSIDKLESANTNKYSNKQYIDSFSKLIETKGITFSEYLTNTLPNSIYKNLQVISFDNNLTINNKYFARRVLYFNDGRFENTDLGNMSATEFHFITIHNKRKYTVTIVCYSDVLSGADVVCLMNSIGGSVKFR